MCLSAQCKHLHRGPTIISKGIYDIHKNIIGTVAEQEREHTRSTDIYKYIIDLVNNTLSLWLFPAPGLVKGCT